MDFKYSKSMHMSPMELRISNILNSHNVEFYREVSFKNLVNPKTNNKLRYDFYIPSYNCFVEYDGLSFHNNTSTKERDDIKDRYAASIGVSIVRLSGCKSISKFEDTYIANNLNPEGRIVIYSSNAIEKSKVLKVKTKRTKSEIIERKRIIREDRLSKINVERKYKPPVIYNNSSSCDLF